MPLTPCFDPSTGAPGGTAPAPVPPADGSPLQIIDCDMSGADLDFSSTVGAVTLGGVEWTTTNSDASVAIAEASGTRIVNDTGNLYYLVTPLGAEVAAGDYICVAIEVDVIQLDTNNQTIQVRLCQAGGTTDTVYDVVMTARRRASDIKARNGYYTSYTMAYIGDTYPTSTTRLVFQLCGSGYSMSTAMTTAAGKPSFRGVEAELNAGGSLRSRGGGQTQGDTLPHYSHLKLILGANNSQASYRIKSVQAWVGARKAS